MLRMPGQCPRCSKSVYHVEEVKHGEKSYHKTCFLCTSCSKTLVLGKLTERQGKLYCDNCYKKNFAPKGCGFGIGAGTLQP